MKQSYTWRLLLDQGWSLARVEHFGRKRVVIYVCGDATNKHISRAEWAEMLKMPLVRVHGRGLQTVFEAKGYHNTEVWDKWQDKVFTGTEFENLKAEAQRGTRQKGS